MAHFEKSPLLTWLKIPRSQQYNYKLAHISLIKLSFITFIYTHNMYLFLLLLLIASKESIQSESTVSDIVNDLAPSATTCIKNETNVSAPFQRTNVGDNNTSTEGKLHINFW